MKVYLAQYSDGPECGMMTLSVHTTRKKAWRAVNQHKALRKAEWDLYPDSLKQQFPWSDERGAGWDAWDVEGMKVQA